MIVFISDFDLHGSGYMHIAVSLCQELSRRGHDVKALGFGYEGQPHPFDFSIIPVPHRGAVSYAGRALDNLIKAEVGIDAIVVALDIPMQAQYLSMGRRNIPYVGIFPVESGPLTASWAAALSVADKCLVISKYGYQQCQDVGLEADYIEIGLDTEAWKPPAPEERAKLRAAFGLTDDDFFILTVADNHERKNLSAAIRMLAEAKHKLDVPLMWSLVTRVEFRGGWKLQDLATEYDIADVFMPYEKGLEFKRIYALYAAADAFLLTSKAEGLCMPILEAMAMSVPVIATDCTAITEHLSDHRGFLIKEAFKTRDVWGNSWRTFADIHHGANQIALVANDTRLAQQRAKHALKYVRGRSVEAAGDHLDTVLRELIDGRADKAKKAIDAAAKIAVL